MLGLPNPGEFPKLLDGFHKELRAIRTLLEQLLELQRERIELDQAAKVTTRRLGAITPA